ncbi:Flagellar hook protein FlgE [Alphaproteobacteria bacterium SO-S41]|nr:Flagellar hook protein FlgE [Alphaproteobacteria bacterium SO-S41]
MSLYGALFTGVSSLAANSRALGISSNNIANVNTVGYKASVAQFETLLSRDTPAGSFSTGGVRTETQQRVTTQGLIQNTDSSTDLSISGQGFFAVNKTPTATTGNGDLLYTRAGSFTPDENGNLRNVQGYYLMGWKLDASGNIPTNTSSLSPISLGQLGGTAQATSNVDLTLNLQASTTAVPGYTPGSIAAGTQTPAFQRTIEVYDSQGGVQPVRLAFIKTAANTWSYEAIYDGNAANIGGAANNPVATGTITFDTNGNLLTPATAPNITIPWAAASGLAPQTFALDLGATGPSGGATQFETPSTATPTSIDGAVFGRLAGVTINTEGYVTAVFDNGIQRQVYKVPLATFTNPDGLTALNSNVYRISEESGPVTLNEANVGGAGDITSDGLEASTVDLAKEFTDMITTQRAYSAATRIISTADAMLQEMLSIKR